MIQMLSSECVVASIQHSLSPPVGVGVPLLKSLCSLLHQARSIFSLYCLPVRLANLLLLRRMASHRRRHHLLLRRSRFLISAILAFFGFIFIILSLIYFLAPYPPDYDQLRLLRRQTSFKNGAGEIRIQKGGGRPKHDIWSSRNAKFYHGCSNASNKFAKAQAITQPHRYLMIVTSGGLNQQRTGITDAVVAARILNATLVVPKLDQKSFWKDASNFSEIFNVEWFISSLSRDLKIIKQLPKKKGRTWNPVRMRVPRKCSEKCYQTRVLPVLLKRHAVQLGKFDYRLANKLDTDLQKLRCRVNYHALKFTYPILEMGKTLVDRMRMKSKHFIALHLRFEPDMLAFSGCYYGGGDKEREDLAVIRRRWKTLHAINPEKARRQGRCPLTPKEVGLMLRALGYGKDVNIYVASGEVYGGERTLAPLKALFPNLYSKETIASKEEMAPFTSFSSRMAALDFTVCDESDVFVTNNNGNMAKILAGRRRYFGHKPTIRPNAKRLYRLSLDQGNMTWEEYASKVRTFQQGFMGEPNEVRAGRGEFHENPSACICEDSEAKKRSNPYDRESGSARKDEEVVDDSDVDDELGTNDEDDVEDQTGFQGLDYDTITPPDEPELEVMLSD